MHVKPALGQRRWSHERERQNVRSKLSPRLKLQRPLKSQVDAANFQGLDSNDTRTDPLQFKTRLGVASRIEWVLALRRRS